MWKTKNIFIRLLAPLYTKWSKSWIDDRKVDECIDDNYHTDKSNLSLTILLAWHHERESSKKVKRHLSVEWLVKVSTFPRNMSLLKSLEYKTPSRVYLYRLLLFEHRGEVWENKTDVFLFSALLSNEQYVWEYKWNHIWIHKLRRESRENPIDDHSLRWEEKQLLACIHKHTTLTKDGHYFYILWRQYEYQSHHNKC